jgi:hypothetical protein
MIAIIYLIIGFFPPLAAGPLAGLVFINIIRRGKGWHQVPFWTLLFVLNLLVALWAISSPGEWLSISSLSAFFFTPAAAIATVLVMRIAWRKNEVKSGLELARNRWFTVGQVLIPFLQVGVFVALLILAPLLCKTGLVVCQNI